MAVVLESVTLGTPRGKRQYRIKPIQRLNGSLFIHAEHRCMTGWVEVKPDDIGSFGFKVRIVAGHIALQPMRLQPSLSPGPMTTARSTAALASVTGSHGFRPKNNVLASRLAKRASTVPAAKPTTSKPRFALSIESRETSPTRLRSKPNDHRDK